MGRHMFRTPLSNEDLKPISQKTVRRVIATFRPYRVRVTVVAAAIVVTATMGIANPLLIKATFDQALFGNPPGQCADGACPNMSLLYTYVGLMIVIPVVAGIIGIGQTYLANQVGLNVMRDLRNALYEHLQRMPLRFFTSTRTGEIQSRLSNDVGGVQTVVTDTASSILNNVVVNFNTGIRVDQTSRTAILGGLPDPPDSGRVAVVCGGTSDLPVALEDALRMLSAGWRGREEVGEFEMLRAVLERASHPAPHVGKVEFVSVRRGASTCARVCWHRDG